MSFSKLFKKLASLTSVGFVFTVLMTVSVVDSSFLSSVAHAAEDDEGPRKPPSARTSQTLGRQVYSRVTEVMEFRDAEDYPSAIGVLDELLEMYDKDRLNDREEYTMWLFYASIAQTQEEYSDAVGYYNKIMEKEENLTQDQLEQTLSSIGALNFVLERFRDAITTYTRYNRIALEDSADVYLRLATAHYQLEEFPEAIPYVIRNMEIVRASGTPVKESTYSLLRALYFTIEDYENTLQIVREMIVLFNQADDWILHTSVQGQLEMFDEQAFTYYVIDVLGHFETEPLLLNLAAQLSNNDNPYAGAMVVERGMASGIIEEDADNLARLSLFYQLAREDERAVSPLLKAAVLEDDSELYNRLGIVYTNMGEFQLAADTFAIALEKGGLDRPDQTYIRQAGAYYQINLFDEGLIAAKEAAKDERSEDTAKTWIGSLERAKVRYDSQEAKRILNAGYFL